MDGQRASEPPHTPYYPQTAAREMTVAEAAESYSVAIVQYGQALERLVDARTGHDMSLAKVAAAQEGFEAAKRRAGV